MQFANEQELVQKCRENCRAAQKELYDKYASLFFTICNRYAKDMHDAEQLLQDGFLKIFQNIQSYEGKGSFEGWMKKILVNTCLDHLKSKQFRTEKLTLYPEDIKENQGSVSFNQAIQSLESAPIMNSIQELSPMTRTVFNLYVFEGYSHKEISRLVGISEGTSQWHVNSARNTLKNKLENLFKEGKRNNEQSRVR